MPQALKRGFARAVVRAAVEMGAVIFLFYSNLLMGEFVRSKPGMDLWSALRDVVTPENFCIACVSALAAYVVFETLREKISK